MPPTGSKVIARNAEKIARNGKKVNDFRDENCDGKKETPWLEPRAGTGSQNSQNMKHIMPQERTACQLSREEKITLLQAEMKSQQKYASLLLERATVAKRRADNARRALMELRYHEEEA